MNAGMTKSPKKESPRRSLRRPMDPESLDERTTGEGRASKIPKTGADAPSSEVTAVSKSSDLAEQEEAYRTKSETGKYAAYDVQNVFMSITDKGKYISLPGTSGSRLPFQRSLETSATSSPCSLQKETSRKEGGSLEGGSAGPDKEDNDSTSSDSTGRLVKDIPMERRKLLASSIQYIKDPSPDPESNESTMPSLESEILPPITYGHHLNVDVQKVPSREYLVPDAEHRKWMCDLVIKCYNLGDAIDIDLTAPALPAARYEDDGFSDDSSDGESEAYQMPSGAMGTVRSAENAYCFTCQMPLDNYVRGWRNNFLKRHPNLKMYSDFPKKD